MKNVKPPILGNAPGSINAYLESMPKADPDGCCTVCGCPLEDPAELTHECPPGFTAPPIGTR